MKEKRKHQFTKEIKLLMYGFGDVQNPRQDSAELLEDILNNYLQDIVIFQLNINIKYL